MLFMVIQTHAPENCPVKEHGGSKLLYDPHAEGVSLKAAYGDYPHHIIYYVLEADSAEAVERFLAPGMTRCTATVAPVAAEA